MKTCANCGETKSREFFEKNRNRCKQCVKERKARYAKENSEKIKAARVKYYKENAEKLKAQKAKYHKENPEKKRALYAKWSKANPEKVKAGKVKWKKENPEKAKAAINKWQKENRQLLRDRESDRYKNDLNFRLRKNLRRRICLVVTKGYKSKSTIELLGCTVGFLKDHLQQKFTEGMTLENYGAWHIDHIKPCALFDLTDIEQQKQCFHYSNLQPLWGVDNIRKGAKYDILSPEP